MEVISEPILGSPLLEWFATYGYWVIIPLMIIEGPIVTVISGVLASLGVFNPFTMFALSVAADLFSDTYFYLFGRYGLDFLDRFKYTRKVAKRVRALQSKTTGVTGFFIRHPGKSAFAAKALPGTTGPGYVLAGALKLDVKRFYFGAVTGGILWSGILIAIGYFFGSTIQNIGTFGIIVGTASLLLVIIFIYNILIKHEIEEHTKIGQMLKDKLNNFNGNGIKSDNDNNSGANK